jgi:hypothetical protein
MIFVAPALLLVRFGYGIARSWHSQEWLCRRVQEFANAWN